MSRIGKLPITVPSGVEVELTPNLIVVKSAKGDLSTPQLPGIKVDASDSQINVTRQNEEKKTRSYHGLQRTLIANMIQGVDKGFTRTLELHGVGYRVQLAGANLKLSVGYSHEVEFAIPQDVKVEVNANVITISGIDKQLVGQTAANIRKIRKPEPYKGKGIRYSDEYIIRKAGKTASS